MHKSHKLWIMISVFIVVIAFLLSMYFTATPDKVGSVISKKRAEQMRKEAPKDTEAVYENTAWQTMPQQEQSLPDALEGVDLRSIKAEGSDMVQSDEEMSKPDKKPVE